MPQRSRTQVGMLGTAAVLVASVLGGCTGGAASAGPGDGTVVVATDYAFGSLNAATAAGRTPGSTLVRGLTSAGFTRLDASGTVVADPSFGTVQKVSDSPLTVRYTVADGVTWSDGVPVSGADLLLEWAARSGQLDEVAASVSGDGHLTVPAAAATSVAFLATSPALVHATATPTVDGHSLTLVYAQPVADWQTALDVNVPAHLVGRLALGPRATAAPRAATVAGLAPTAGGSGSPTDGVLSPSSSATSSPSATVDWADQVARAITSADHTRLVAISAAWRAWGDASSLTADPGLAVTTGPYRVSSLSDDRVVLTRNTRYTGSHPGTAATVVVRSDLNPLQQVTALRAGSVEVALPTDTADVRKAADGDALTVRTGTAAVLQLQLGEQPTSPFAGPEGAARRAAFVGALDRAALARAAGADPSGTVLAQLGATWPGSTSAAGTGPSTPAASASATPATSGTPTPSASAGTPVRLLVDTADPTRAALAEAIRSQAASAGFAVTVVAGDTTVALRSQPGRWDAALVPVAQDPLPVSGVVARWHTGGATNVTAHTDGALDQALDAADGQLDPAAVTSALLGAQTTLTASHVVAPLVRQPSIAVVRAGDAQVADVTPLDWSAADQTAWWSWLR